MSVFLAILVVVFMYITARIGAIALQMTDLDMAASRFQALSALTGTGFTTRESEDVVNHPIRRKIITTLILIGRAGLVSVISTVMVSLSHQGVVRPSLNLLAMVVAFFVLYRLAGKVEVTHRWNRTIRQHLAKIMGITESRMEILLHQPGGLGVTQVLVGEESNLNGKMLKETEFTKHALMVLSIQRDRELIAVPKAETMIQCQDRLTCYGKIKNLKTLI